MSRLIQSGNKGNLVRAFGLGACLVGVAAFWLAKVNEAVPEPYLVSESSRTLENLGIYAYF